MNFYRIYYSFGLLIFQYVAHAPPAMGTPNPIERRKRNGREEKRSGKTWQGSGKEGGSELSLKKNPKHGPAEIVTTE